MGSKVGLAAGRRGARKRRLALATALALILLTGTAWAGLRQLPAGAQVNDDPAAGIDPARSVSGEDPTNADVVGGALTAGKVAVPWAIFRQQTGGKDQVFVRSFGAGAWTTRGSGTAGGRSSASPVFGGSLNFDQAQDGEAPEIDFAGAGRTVPWASWYETTSGTGFGNNNIFASRFDNTGDANQGRWLFAGQNRATTGTPVPSLNINTNQDAENPSVAGGSTANPGQPGPWTTWQETASGPAASLGKDQIFVVKPLGPGRTNCAGVTPAAVDPNAVPVGGFCWQQVGIDRVGQLGQDPSLNVDPTRNGTEPDIAFTGANDSVPWIVWYESGASGISGLRGNEMVFAARAVADGGADGGFHWKAVGHPGGGGALDTSGAHGFGPCAESQGAEDACSLNADPGQNAEDPRIAAGTMTPGNPTVPWIAWDEKSDSQSQIFVARLVGGDHFELANGGRPISQSVGSSTRPDIIFSGNTPYVTWRADTGGGVEKAFSGHFVDAASPTFVLDSSGVDITPTAQADVREPISSSCAATPFNGDGASCQGDAVGTPFFLFTTGSAPGPLALLSDGYEAGPPVTGAARTVDASGTDLTGTVDPEGGPVTVRFEYGPTTAYGQTTAPQRFGPASAPVPFAAHLAGLAPGTMIHYRAVALTDFATTAGGDSTLTVAAPPTRKLTLKLKATKTTLKSLLRSGRLAVTVSADQACTVRLSGAARTGSGHGKKATPLFKQATLSLKAAGQRTVKLKLTKKGARALAHLRKAKITVLAGAVDASGGRATKKLVLKLSRR